MSTPLSTSVSPKYGEQVLVVEPYGVETVGISDRHGKAQSQFTLWLGSNLTIADFALGFLPISLGLPWTWAIAAILVGNVMGALVLSACAAMGPTYGVPQLMIGRYTFGRMGGYLPALLNYVSTIGWFTVNNILGTFGLKVLFPGLLFWQGATILVVVQGLVAVYGHNLIHAYERIMSIVLAALFLVASVIALKQHAVLAAYHPTGTALWPMFAIMVGAAFSYIGSWGPYASDYSRYLRSNTNRRQVISFAFWGSFLASVWLELVGAAVAVLAGPHHGDPISSLHTVMGGFGVLAVVAIILGGTAADALNLYSNTLSAGALDIRIPRWLLAIFASMIGWGLSLSGAGHFEQNYEDFLLMLGYWMTPWVGVLFTDFYLLRAHKRAAQDGRNRKPVIWPGFLSFILGIAVSVPFMNCHFYTGPIAARLNGVDLSFYVGFVVAGGLYLAFSKMRKKQV
jgi:NCS1 family nucleobase:cation symporter-1